VGPFTTRNQERLVSDFKRICEKHSIMHFNVVGYDTFEQSKVVFIDIKPDTNMDEFRWELSKTLQPYCYLTQYDLERKFEYHTTLAMKLDSHRFNQINKYIQEKPKPNFRHTLMRVTLIRNQKILYEYDFLLKRLLTRREAKSGKILSQSFNKLKNQLGEIVKDNVIGTLSNIEEIDLETIKEGLLRKLISRFRKRKIFFISDTHFDHTNIIKHCNRPFHSTNEMNETMLANWNNTVKSNDVVLFLGDMSCGRGSRGADYWLSKLNGNIFFINGFKYGAKNEHHHDETSRKKNVFDSLIIKYKDKKFFLIHDPAGVPKDWKDWAICGHHHNNHLDEFPLVNKKTKRINVSVELIDYKPILLEDLLKLI
jgi:calcineurin-like phosphoesterase family protein